MSAPSTAVDRSGDEQPDQLRIFGWSADNSGCEWYRIKLPLDALTEHHGYVTSFGRLLTSERPNVLIGQRTANPAPSSLWQALSSSNGGLGPAALSLKYFDVPQWCHDVLAERAPRPKLIYELDDDLFNVDPANGSAFRFFGNPKVANTVRSNLFTADAVTVSTTPLAEVIRQHTDAPIFVVPNYLPDWLPYTDDQMRGLQIRAGSQRRTIIGWAGGPSHVADWAELSGSLSRFLQRTPADNPYASTELHMVGAQFGGTFDRMRFTKWAASVPDFYRLLDFDIGLAPLRPSVFNRSKSAIKVMEYQALGIVPVASNVGPYADYICDGVSGVLVDRPHEWATFLRWLVENPEGRAKIARAGWEQAKRNTIGQHVDEWKRVIDAVLQ